MQAGPFGIGWLRPHAMFGIEEADPLLHALFWSMTLNTLAFCTVSLASFPDPVERLQSAQFVNAFEQGPGARGWSHGLAEAEDMLVMSQRILGPEAAQSFFAAQARAQLAGAREDLARYETLLAVHILSVAVLLIWFPFGKLMHAALVFVSRGSTGALFERKGASI
ncbi:hypothetical protein GALL_548200 [mine drainage metagenome]|uniref:Uncharacterized protein n=1 Tax=mine drainage metagenome TaxID=410659 RepID=A0A1J5NZG3_9ZZZZ